MDEEMLRGRPEPEVDADGRVVVWESSSDDELMVTTSARIRGATLVATPAFADALVALEDADEELPALVAAAAIVEEAERALVAPVLPPAAWRSDERRVGEEGGSTGRSRWEREH